MRPRARSKNQRPIDLAWSRGLVTVKNRVFLYLSFVVVEKQTEVALDVLIVTLDYFFVNSVFCLWGGGVSTVTRSPLFCDYDDDHDDTYGEDDECG